jgi:hypothetical protein
MLDESDEVEKVWSPALDVPSTEPRHCAAGVMRHEPDG